MALNEIIRQVVELTRARWHDIPLERGVVIRVEMRLAPSLPTIMGAGQEIRDALTNLILNAVDAMPDGGRMTITSRIIDGPARVEIAVRDTGVGMNDETRSRCLEPFFTTKGERGTGLGLAMVYGMVQRHSADLEIDSDLGEGTCMRLCFPTAVAGKILADAGAQPARVQRKLRILVIDDDPMLLKSLRDALERDGHSVVVAEGGQSGIDAFFSTRGGANDSPPSSRISACPMSMGARRGGDQEQLTGNSCHPADRMGAASTQRKQRPRIRRSAAQQAPETRRAARSARCVN